MTFKVQNKACSTCIYRKDSPLELPRLEAQVADGYGGFKEHRVCHHSDDVCCRGFWNRHRDKFAAGQVAQRLGLVEFVEVDNLAGDCLLVPRRERTMLETVVQLIRTTRLDLSSEKRAQADLEEAFTRAGIAFDREVPLTKTDVIDFMVEGLGVELKLRTAGKKAVYRQLCRYARHERVERLLLASNLSMGLPPSIEGKDAYFVKLGEAWL